MDAPCRWGTLWGPPLPGSLRVLDAVGQAPQPRLAAEHCSRSAAQHNPAAVMRTKVEQFQRTRSRGLCGLVTSQPPQLMLDSIRRGAEFGGDPAEQEALGS